MKRSWIIFLSGVALAVTAYLLFFSLATRPGLPESAPELAWLKTEYQLSDAQYTRVCKLHAEYAPQCREMCRRIDRQNLKLQQLLAGATALTPEIERALAEAAQLRTECQTMMLKHFFEIGRFMPPEQGRRYLAWMQAQTLIATNHPPSAR